MCFVLFCRELENLDFLSLLSLVFNNWLAGIDSSDTIFWMIEGMLNHALSDYIDIYRYQDPTEEKGTLHPHRQSSREVGCCVHGHS